MVSASRLRAENRFAAIEKRQKKVLSEQEEAVRAVNENTARLKALRLAKEAKDRAEKLAEAVGTGKRAVGRSVS